MGLLSSKSSTVVTTTTQNWTDSFNRWLSKSDVISEAGNTNITIGAGSAGASPSGALASLPDWWPVVAVGGLLGLMLLLSRRPALS